LCHPGVPFDKSEFFAGNSGSLPINAGADAKSFLGSIPIAGFEQAIR